MTLLMGGSALLPTSGVVRNTTQVHITTLRPNIHSSHPCSLKEARKYKLNWQQSEDAKSCMVQPFCITCFNSSESSVTEEPNITVRKSKGKQKKLRGNPVMLEKPRPDDQHVSSSSNEGEDFEVEKGFKISSVTEDSNTAVRKRKGKQKKPRGNPVVVEKPQTDDQDVSSSSNKGEDFEVEKGFKISKVCDRLIEVFLVERPRSNDWRKLLAYSDEWKKIKPHFFTWCNSRAQSEADPKKRDDILNLAIRLKEVDEDMERHNKLLTDIEEHPLEIDIIVARRREDFTTDFFKHLRLLSESNCNNLERKDELVSIVAKCLSAVEAYDTAVEDGEALRIAQLKLDDILNSPSFEDACHKIEQMSKKKQLDSAFMLLMTKAWSAAKESNVVKEEAKDIMYRLYMVARGNVQRLVPKEILIIRHILSIEEPRKRMEALTDAFSPGDELEEKRETDKLYTKPDRLYKWINIILDAYSLNKQSALLDSVKPLMNPMIIQRLQMLKEIMDDEFL